jgi:hypothetical protein
MQVSSSPAPLAHTSLLLICSAGRTPTASATAGRPSEARLALEAAGGGYGATVVLIGPARSWLRSSTTSEPRSGEWSRDQPVADATPAAPGRVRGPPAVMGWSCGVELLWLGLQASE